MWLSVRNAVWDVGEAAEDMTQTEHGPKTGTELLQHGCLILFIGNKWHFHAVFHLYLEHTPERDQMN